MISTNNPNINSKNYWNGIYGDPIKRAEYEALTHRGIHQVIGNRLLNPSFRIHQAVDLLKDNQKVLDIGCGVGIFTKLAKDKFPNCEVWGVDISDQAIEANKKEHSDITYLHQYVGNLDKVPKGYFDVVFAGEILEHLDDPSILLKDACSVLKTGGKLILTTPMTTAVNSSEHVWYFDKRDVKKLFVDNGFTSPKFIDLPDLEHLVVIFAVGVKNA